MRVKPSVYAVCTVLFMVLISTVMGANAQVGNTVNLARGASYWLSQPPSATYPDVGGKSLTDGRKGTPEYGNPAWQGHLREEFRVVTVDLGHPKRVEQVDIGFLNDFGAGIFLPDQVMLQTSANGRDWSDTVTITKPEMGALASPARIPVSFTDVNAVARYVRIAFFVEVWVHLDEIEVWGTDDIVDIGGPSDLLDLNDPYLGIDQADALQPWQYDKLPETETNAYFPAGNPAAAGVKHMMLIYTHADWTVGDALPYVAYSQRDPTAPRFAPARWEDWFFDTFLFLALRTPDGKRAFDSASRGAPATWDDWVWFLDYLFTPDQQLHAFNEAVARAKTFIDDPDYKAKVVVMIPHPIPSTTDFGDPYGNGESLSFASYPQGPQKQHDARLRAIQAYLTEFDQRWATHEFPHLELVGLYWLSELIDGRSDMQLLQSVAALAQQREQKLFWIPYYNAVGWAQWETAGFDAAIYQPNYMFNTNVPLTRLADAAASAKRYGLGVEIEADETTLVSAAGRARYYEYLKAGVRYGFMNEALHGYYQGRAILRDAFAHPNSDIRRLYDATYEYVKGTYDPEAD